MAEDNVTLITPVTVAMVGTGTGDGMGAPITPGTVAKTPDHQPNIVLNVITPAVAIIVRFVTLFLTTFVGLITAAGIGTTVFQATDFHGIVVGSATAALTVASVGLLKNLITIFSGLEGRYPLGTGSI